MIILVEVGRRDTSTEGMRCTVKFVETSLPAHAGETYASEWLAQPDVVKALHVNADGGGMTYQKGPMELSGDLRPLYAK